MINQVCVCGLWHLGSVVAASLAEHFPTIGYDPDPQTVAKLEAGQPPIFEPGLAQLVEVGLSSGRLSFTAEFARAVQGADVVWITFDTPVDENDVADVAFVERQTEALFPHLADGALVLVSSQLPVGTTAQLEAAYRSAHPERDVGFAHSPENLRLGRALEAFRQPDRIVAGVRREADRVRLQALFAPFCQQIEWMSVESAEMTKHALNAFLATSVTLINELAALCERVGADAGEVERGLKTDQRIGPRAYLSPGAAFAGGTLARDIAFLNELGTKAAVRIPLLEAVTRSNHEQKHWPARKLKELLGDPAGKVVAVLGLTYKPDTNTLRRSSAVELCLWLERQGARVRAYDPAVPEVPPELARAISLCATAEDAVRGADALVLATPWPVFKILPIERLLGEMRQPIVIDPTRFLQQAVAANGHVLYATVGRLVKRA
jgi:UDPglucose 6-dehydrogenase